MSSLVHNDTWRRDCHEPYGEKKFFPSQIIIIPDVKFFDNLIGWTLANAGDTMLE